MLILDTLDLLFAAAFTVLGRFCGPLVGDAGGEPLLPPAASLWTALIPLTDLS